MTSLIRDALANGALSPREIADYIGVRRCKDIHPYLSQMRHRTHEVVRTAEGKYALRKQRTALAGAWP